MAYNKAKGLISILDQTASPKAWIKVPLSYIKFEEYSITPNQRIDLDSYVSESGNLIRNVLSHTRTKLEFTTPIITRSSLVNLQAIFNKGFYDALERNIRVRYYDPETDDYKIMTAYMPDAEFGMRHVDEDNPEISYSGVRFAFIEY